MMVGPPNSAFFQRSSALYKVDLRQDLPEALPEDTSFTSTTLRKREQHSVSRMALVIGYHKIRGLGAPLRMICYYKSQPFTNVSRSHSMGGPRVICTSSSPLLACLLAPTLAPALFEGRLASSASTL